MGLSVDRRRRKFAVSVRTHARGWPRRSAATDAGSNPVDCSRDHAPFHRVGPCSIHAAPECRARRRGVRGARRTGRSGRARAAQHGRNARQPRREWCRRCRLGNGLRNTRPAGLLSGRNVVFSRRGSQRRETDRRMDPHARCSRSAALHAPAHAQHCPRATPSSALAAPQSGKNHSLTTVGDVRRAAAGPDRVRSHSKPQRSCDV